MNKWINEWNNNNNENNHKINKCEQWNFLYWKLDLEVRFLKSWTLMIGIFKRNE